jgi:hypothetical protein
MTTRAAIGLMLAVLLLLPIAGDVQEPHPVVPPGELTVHNYGERDPTCYAWSDGCRICTSGFCSNIGIACQPSDIRCTQR